MSDQQFNKDSYPPSPSFNPVPETEIIAKQSKLGIASFILGIVSIIGFIISIIILYVNMVDIIGEFPTEESVMAIEDPEVIVESMIFPVLFMLFFVVASIVGLILGITGACMKHTRKAFSIIGIVLNALLFVGFLMSLILGTFSQVVDGI
ncbi:hypothetical protein PAECIP111893_01378 [Paenibacillus plantiphilus]|uniref:DUF4064 domain-containing protein n=1 Tax=Paenibacillus plantiphilus TaxID=2905650 RepID=A0ABM9C3F0_9BACL|nr:hypothetical protein [Paenibacillus plantiphilus]CAH1200437.1 hypothetical protein PAECIP111893_01378 [Paenibacillus plantiphilus]